MDTAALQDAARTAAAAAGIPVEIFFGLIQTESAWNPDAVSGAGAIGLTQVMPWWAPKLGMTVEQLADPVQNLTAGAKIFGDELRYFGDPALAAMAYNAGRGAVNKAISTAGSRDPATVSPYLPAAETRAYWQKVIRWAQHFAGQISAAAATVENVATDVTETVKDSPGTTALLFLLFASMAFLASR